MLFNSYLFILLFLPIVLIGYFGLNHVKQNGLAMIFLTGMSLWFCGSENVLYMVILLCSMLTNYLLFRLLKSHTPELTKHKLKQLILVLGIAANIGGLLYFKYCNFFLQNINAIFKTNLTLVQIILPLGISFYTFSQISFLVEAYRGEDMNYTFLEYMVYVSFFPKLIQGPIASPQEIVSQLRNPDNRKLNMEHMSKGLYSFALGLGKKVLLADALAKLVNAGYSNVSELNTFSAVVVMLAYSLQIYFDFSGYCDMACGIGLMLNIELPVNFNSPYKAESITDFWGRWHITLTRFFTKYIYIPLGGSRAGQARTYLNIFIVFLISGFWHGANWTFLLWGVLNGLMMIIERMFQVSKWKLPKGVKVTGAFLLTTAFWSIFRAASLSEAGLLWNRLFSGGTCSLRGFVAEAFENIVEVSVLYRAGLGGWMDSYPGLFPVLFLLILILACVFMSNTQEKVQKMKLTTGKMLVTVGLLFWSILSLSEISEFIYFNF